MIIIMLLLVLLLLQLFVRMIWRNGFKPLNSISSPHHLEISQRSQARKKLDKLLI